MIYVPRYALRGPVYLEQRGGCSVEQEVLYYDERLGGPVWTTGKISAESDQSAIHVEAEGRKRRQTYKLFDHVTVTIQLKVNWAANEVFTVISRRNARRFV